MPENERPDRYYRCQRCNRELVRGYGDVTCDCGAEYNSGGQRLRDDWRNNPSTYDDEIGDMEGYEMEHAGD